MLSSSIIFAVDYRPMKEDSSRDVQLETASKLGISASEYDMICDHMDRPPNFTELSIYSVMWSEHCSYKNSIMHLKTLPRDGEKLLVGAGEENAGLVDLGDGLACAFKIESHNHPSAIEPYQGAATGVGGIHRDIFTMGARPIAAMNSLRFGVPDTPRMKRLVKGVVSGIGDYGNCLGVPTVGGEVYFHPCYQQNILVNAMSVGLVKHGETASAVADGPGNPVFIVGSATGRDGIHGATFASGDLTENSAEDLPAVQVGDPFQEKLLLEATLEAIATGALVGVQDMGAAGITCSCSEMSAKSETGMDIDLDKVPTRQEGMQPFEILLSESQERMLMVCEKGKEAALLAVFDKWDLHCAQIGVVTDTGRLRYSQGGEIVADVPADSLVLGGGAPVYDRETKRPRYMDAIAAFRPNDIAVPDSCREYAWQIAGSPTVASKQWIYRQYDHTVRTNNTTTTQAGPCPVIRLKGTGMNLAISTDCNSNYVYADPKRGTMMAVCEAARNIVCAGGEPLAITNCLNFGNPYNPEVFYQFSEAIKGMGEACRALDTPVTGGNVSFYNHTVLEDSAEPVRPTPTIGMIGLIKDDKHRSSIEFQNSGDQIYVIGHLREDMGSSEYLMCCHDVQHSPAPIFHLEEELALHEVIRNLHDTKVVKSIQDVSEGGIFISLLESAMSGKCGFEISTDQVMRQDAFLFGESQSRIVISIAPSDTDKLEKLLDQAKFPYRAIGSVNDCEIKIDGETYGQINDWTDRYSHALAHTLATS